MRKTVDSNILVVAAHPDDEVLGCGASIAKHAKLGDHVQVLILGEGVASRRKLTPVKKKGLIKELRTSAKVANELLGVESLTLKNFPDNKFDCVPLLDIVQTVEEACEKFRPDIIYTHSFADVNVDHRITVEAVQTAFRPVGLVSFRKILSFEIASSTEWNFIRVPFNPNFFVKVSEEDLEKKLKAMECYLQEMSPFPHPRSRDYLMSLSKIRGSQSAFEFAEGFQVINCRED